MRTLTPYLIAAAALTLAACGSDSPVCVSAPACSASPTIVAGASILGGQSHVACGNQLYTSTTCQQDQSSTCHEPVVSVSNGTTEMQLGTHTVGEVVRFTVPAGTAGFSIVSQRLGTPGTYADSILISGQLYPNVVVPDQVRAPNGDLVYDDTVNAPSDPSGQLAFYATASPVTGAFTIPNTTNMLGRTTNGVQSGQWQFVVNDYANECPRYSNCAPATNPAPPPAQYDVRVVLRSGKVSDQGTVDVALYLAGLNVTAAQAVSDPGIARFVSSLAKIYGTAGLCIGTVTTWDLPQWAETKYGTLNIDNLDPCGDLNQMFTLSEGGSQLNFFLVGGFYSSSSGPQQIVGIDGTIPGPSVYSGTIHSGAAVNAADLESGTCQGNPNFGSTVCGADNVAYIAAHEGGHWLGLYHTTERYGDSFDALADTTKCPCQSCAPSAKRSSCADVNPSTSSPTTVDDSMCTGSVTSNSGCGGADALMFWLYSSSSRATLSCEQAMVMRTNPAVH